MEKMMKVLTDPVANHILQLIRVRETMTIAEIAAACSQVPRATIYRKMDKMLEVGAIRIAGSRKVRGQTENRYTIQEMYLTGRTEEETRKVVTVSLMQILHQFDGYFRAGDVDVERDKLYLRNFAVPLSDEDFLAMTKELFQVVDHYMQKAPTADARLRSLYLLSAPGGDDYEAE